MFFNRIRSFTTDNVDRRRRLDKLAKTIIEDQGKELVDPIRAV